MVIKCKNDHICLMMSSVFCLRGFGLVHIFRIGYVGLVFDFAQETCKKSYTYVFSMESLSSLSSCTVSIYDRVKSIIVT